MFPVGLSRQKRQSGTGSLLHREINICSGCVTKFCHRDFVLKYVVIGGKKDFQVESKSGSPTYFGKYSWQSGNLTSRIGTCSEPILEQIGTFIVICTEMLNGLK